MMSAGTKFQLLLYLAILSRVYAGPFSDPDENDDNVTLKYAGGKTTIYMKEQNKPDICIAKMNFNGSVDTIANLGLSIKEYDDKSWCLHVAEVQDYDKDQASNNYSFKVELDLLEDVELYIVNIDDNTPYFDMKSSTCEVKENFIGKTPCTFTVYDADGMLENMKFSVFKSETKHDKIVLIDDGRDKCKKIGYCIDVVIKIEEYLDFLDEPFESLTLQAIDNAGHIGNLSYVVQVKSVNKNVPKINPGKVQQNIKEGFSGIIDFEKTMFIEDYDSGDFGQFSITLKNISAKDCFKAFSIIPTQGYLNTTVKVTVIEPELLDYESKNCNNTLQFEIVATEKSDNTRKGTAQVTINLTDENDEYPEFKKKEYNFTIKENEQKGTIIGSVFAEDKDEEDNILTYSLSSENFLAIDENGNITTVMEFDYERLTDVIVTVRAMDKGNHFAYTQINLWIEDVNDVKPELYITPSTQTNIKEGSKSNEELEFIITAIDPDSTANLTFSIDWTESKATKQGALIKTEDFERCFKLNNTETTETNSLTVKVLVDDDSKLDWGKFDALYLAIKIEDSNTEEGYKENRFNTATLTINIDDVNDKSPVFSRSKYSITVRENTAPGTLIGFVVAKDEDGPENNKISYSITCEGDDKEYVVINSETGQIHTGKNEIDFEKLSQSGIINCVVKADDNIPEHKAEATLEITVIDVNDNTPIFTKICDDISIEEHTNVSKVLCEFKATDEDGTAPYKTIYYQTNSKTFVIDPDNGTLYLKEGLGNNLDYENEIKEYNVQISISDNCTGVNGNCGGESRSGVPTTILIKLKDINDKNPEFPSNEADRTTSITEEIKEDDEIIKIIATDEDDDKNKELNYEILNVICVDCRDKETCGKFFFKIKDNGDSTANLLAAKSFINCWGEYVVELKATDQGTCDGIENKLCQANRSSTTNYRIIVDDINNNLPEFKLPDKHIEVELTRNTVQGSKLIDIYGKEITVKAVDDYDKGIHGSAGIKYTIIGDETAIKHLNLTNQNYPNYPRVQLNEGFTNETNKSFKMEIKACDAECADSFQQANIISDIKVKGGDYPPTFDDHEWNTSFPENEDGHSVWHVIDVEARDVDNSGVDDPEDWENIFYYIVEDGVAEKLFTLDKNSRNLTLRSNEKLDRENTSSYTIIVAASNNEMGLGVNVHEESKLAVNIKVEDVKDTPPKFKQELFTGGINIGDKNTDNFIVQLSATDEDINDKLTYHITGKIEADPTLQYITKPFDLEADTGNLLRIFHADDTSLKGTFAFKVEVKDSVGLTDTTTVKVHMITDENILVFTFSDSRIFVDSQREYIEKVFKEVLKKEARIKNVVPSSQTKAADADTENDWTDVSSYFVSKEENKPISKDEIRNMVNAPDTFNALISNLTKYNLHLRLIESPADTNESNMDGVLQTVLIVVSVVLGTLVIILFGAFFIKTRSLNRRLEALSTTKFGSQDSGLNRIGMAVPNTNKHAIEGSNPVWGNEDVDNHNFDNQSVSSGDSDLIGVEENPEFMSGNTTPDIEGPRRPTGLPMVGSDAEFGANFSPFSSTAMAELEAQTVGRRPSVNPLAGTNLNYVKHDSDKDSEAESARSSNATVDHNSNFSILKRTDSAPTTEL